MTVKTERNTPEKKGEHPKGKKRVRLNCIRTEFNTNVVTDSIPMAQQWKNVKRKK